MIDLLLIWLSGFLIGFALTFWLGVRAIEKMIITGIRHGSFELHGQNYIIVKSEMRYEPQ